MDASAIQAKYTRVVKIAGKQKTSDELKKAVNICERLLLEKRVNI